MGPTVLIDHNGMLGWDGPPDGTRTQYCKAKTLSTTRVLIIEEENSRTNLIQVQYVGLYFFRRVFILYKNKIFS